ncbi:MAG: hypothetical protein KDB11_07385 [Planctomycetales bacterium]|nr:hypothetical protein [Planctomycetales bacterium]
MTSHVSPLFDPSSERILMLDAVRIDPTCCDSGAARWDHMYIGRCVEN